MKTLVVTINQMMTKLSRVLQFNLLGSRLQELNVLEIQFVMCLQTMIKTLSLGLGLLKVCLFVKLESSDYRIYWSKSARLDQQKIRLDRLNLVHIYFFCRISNLAQACLTCRVLCFTPSIKRKTLATFQKFLMRCVLNLL